MNKDPDKWFFDKISRDLIQLHSIEEMLYSGRTKFQSVEIMKTGSFGKCLVLDSKIQSSEVDEFVYHEALVQTAMVAHPRPERVFVAGGGEGATLREILRHKTVQKAVMVDIDEEVIAICKKFLPEYGDGAFEDKRAEVHHTDAREFLAKSGEAFDIVVIDLTEPIEAGPAYLLYTREFYQLVRERLTPDGIITVQSGSASYTELLCFGAVYNTLKSVFPVVSPFLTDIPSFGGPWGFCVASMKLNPALLSASEIDNRIVSRSLKLKFYDGQSHQGMFGLPRHVRSDLEQQTRLITDQEPLYVYQDL